MANAREFCKLIVICLTVLSLSANNRDPFKPMSKVDNVPTLNAILTIEDKRFASISYNDRDFSVTTNEKIDNNFIVKEINQNTVRLLNSQTDQEEVIRLRD